MLFRLLKTISSNIFRLSEPEGQSNMSKIKLLYLFDKGHLVTYMIFLEGKKITELFIDKAFFFFFTRESLALLTKKINSSLDLLDLVEELLRY